MSKGIKRSGARPGRPHPLRGTKGKREVDRLSLHDALPILYRKYGLLCGASFGGFGPLTTAWKLVFRVSRRDSQDRKSTRLNSSHTVISYAVFCLKKKIKIDMSKHDIVQLENESDSLL